MKTFGKALLVVWIAVGFVQGLIYEWEERSEEVAPIQSFVNCPNDYSQPFWYNQVRGYLWPLRLLQSDKTEDRFCFFRNQVSGRGFLHTFRAKIPFTDLTGEQRAYAMYVLGWCTERAERNGRMEDKATLIQGFSSDPLVVWAFSGEREFQEVIAPGEKVALAEMESLLDQLGAEGFSQVLANASEVIDYYYTESVSRCLLLPKGVSRR